MADYGGIIRVIGYGLTRFAADELLSIQVLACRMAIKWLFLTGMGKHSVADAKNRLSELIDRALEGEDVVITRHGRPVVELTPIAPAPKPLTPEAVDWLAQRRVGRRMPQENAAATVRRLRNEWAR